MSYKLPRDIRGRWLQRLADPKSESLWTLAQRCVRADDRGRSFAGWFMELPDNTTMRSDSEFAFMTKLFELILAGEDVRPMLNIDALKVGHRPRDALAGTIVEEIQFRMEEGDKLTTAIRDVAELTRRSPEAVTQTWNRSRRDKR